MNIPYINRLPPTAKLASSLNFSQHLDPSFYESKQIESLKTRKLTSNESLDSRLVPISHKHSHRVNIMPVSNSKVMIRMKTSLFLIA